MKEMIRVAIIQPKPYPSPEDPRNIGHALQLMEKCRGEQLDVVCLPEYFPAMGEREIGAAARRLNCYVIAGVIEEDEGKRYDTAVLFNRSGRPVGTQRKFSVGALERERLGVLAGDGVFRGFETDFGKVGIPVGIDFWGQPEAARQLSYQGVDIVFNPSVFTSLRGHWKTGSLVRAFDNFIPVVGINTADYNAMFGEKRIHQHGGGSFVLQPPKMLDRDDFNRWARSVDNIQSWAVKELDELEQVHVADVSLASGARFRGEFYNRFGFKRL